MKIFQHIAKIAVSSVACLILLLSGGCTEERLSDCDLYLRFRYDYNMNYQDLFTSQVGRVQLFVFDNDGKYHSTISQSGQALKNGDFRIQIPYELRNHTIVVWADSTNNSYDLTSIAQNDPIEKLFLRYNPVQHLSNKLIDNLWHSGPIKLAFTEDYNTQQTVSLLKNSNDFHIRVVDETSRPIQGNVKIVASNGSYNHKNEYLTNNEPITYMPHRNENGLAEIRTLRLMESSVITLWATDQSGNPITMGGSEQINLVEYLLKSAPSGMSAQEYLDRCYNWNITLMVDQRQAYVVLSITINNWVHWFQDIDNLTTHSK